MRCLLYCVCLDSDAALPRLHGVDLRPVHAVSEAGLCTAISLVSEGSLAPSLERIRAYQAVVDAIFQTRAVVPMRYGSSLPSREAVAQFLREGTERFRPLLHELTGCVEMGVRIFNVPEARARRAASRSPQAMRHAATRGRAYLVSRRGRYEAADEPVPGVGVAIEQYRSAFEGLYVKFKAEPALPLNLVLGVSEGRLRVSAAGGGRRLGEVRKASRGSLALYFLVRREQLAAFRERCSRLRQRGAELLLSGPWPPYNFVATGA